MTSNKLLALNLKLGRYYKYYLEQNLIVKEIEGRCFLKRLIAIITLEYAVAKIVRNHFDDEIKRTIEELMRTSK